MGSGDTRIHRPDGVVSSGEVVGHADRQSRVRGPDGLLFKGEEKGYVDRDKNIRRPDGLLFRGEVVGQVKGNRAHAPDGIILPGEEWGYVDEQGNIRQRDGLIFRGRIIGGMRGSNRAAALAFFVLRFKEIEAKVEALEQELRPTPHKARFMVRISRMLEWVPKAEALGDFDSLLRRLRALESVVSGEIEQNRQRKTDLCLRAEQLSDSQEWQGAAQALRALQHDWKTVGPAGRDHDSPLWNRFRAAQDRFYRRQAEHFERRHRERQACRQRKEQLCGHAESLSRSTDWKATSETMRALQEEWRRIGSPGKDDDASLWHRFRQAQDVFFQRRAEARARRSQEELRNLGHKERLCAEAEALAASDDPHRITGRLKELNAEWKTSGPAPRERAEATWARFRRACDHAFARATELRDRRHREWERKQTAWRSSLREALSRKTDQAARLRESIEHDEENIARWQGTIHNLRPGGRADDIRESLEDKIADVESRIRSKQGKLEHLEEAIRDIRSKLDGA